MRGGMGKQERKAKRVWAKEIRKGGQERKKKRKSRTKWQGYKGTRSWRREVHELKKFSTFLMLQPFNTVLLLMW